MVASLPDDSHLLVHGLEESRPTLDRSEWRAHSLECCGDAGVGHPQVSRKHAGPSTLLPLGCLTLGAASFSAVRTLEQLSGVVHVGRIMCVGLLTTALTCQPSERAVLEVNPPAPLRSRPTCDCKLMRDPEPEYQLSHSQTPDPRKLCEMILLF